MSTMTAEPADTPGRIDQVVDVMRGIADGEEDRLRALLAAEQVSR